MTAPTAGEGGGGTLFLVSKGAREREVERERKKERERAFRRCQCLDFNSLSLSLPPLAFTFRGKPFEARTRLQMCTAGVKGLAFFRQPRENQILSSARTHAHKRPLKERGEKRPVPYLSDVGKMHSSVFPPDELCKCRTLPSSGSSGSRARLPHLWPFLAAAATNFPQPIWKSKPISYETGG